MKKHSHLSRPPSSPQQRKRIITVSLFSLFTLLLLIAIALTPPILSSYLSKSITSTITRSLFVESKLHVLPIPAPSSQLPRPAYHISGSAGHAHALKRTPLAVYPPHNCYVAHLDRESREEERVRLKQYVKAHALCNRFDNVRVVEKANLIMYHGPTMVANPQLVTM